MISALLAHFEKHGLNRLSYIILSSSSSLVPREHDLQLTSLSTWQYSSILSMDTTYVSISDELRTKLLR